MAIHVSQGEWKFELRVYTSATKYTTLTPIQKYFNLTDNVLDVGSIANSGNGYFEVSELKVPRLYENHSDRQYVKCYLQKISNGSVSGTKTLNQTLSVAGTTTSVVAYKLNSTQVSTGTYLMTLELYEKIGNGAILTDTTISKEVSVVKVSNGLKTTVHGTSNPEAFVPIVLEGLQTETGITGKIIQDNLSNSKVDLTCTVSDADWYQWYYNGAAINGATTNTLKQYSVKTGNWGIGLYGSVGNYFDCIFMKNGILSSCSFVCVTKGALSGSRDDSSVFTLNTGDEIKKWSYASVAPNELKSGFSFMPVGESNNEFFVVAEGSPYISKGYWSFSNVTAYNGNNKSLGDGGVWSGYINGSSQKVGVRLNQHPDTKQGKLQIKNLIAVCNTNVDQSCTLTVTIYDTSGNQKESKSYEIKKSGKSFTFDEESFSIASGVYRGSITIVGKANSDNYYGYCNLILNVYDDVTTEITGKLSFDYT